MGRCFFVVDIFVQEEVKLRGEELKIGEVGEEFVVFLIIVQRFVVFNSVVFYVEIFFDFYVKEVKYFIEVWVLNRDVSIFLKC